VRAAKIAESIGIAGDIDEEAFDGERTTRAAATAGENKKADSKVAWGGDRLSSLSTHSGYNTMRLDRKSELRR
jgi:hypothetical protein